MAVNRQERQSKAEEMKILDDIITDYVWKFIYSICKPGTEDMLRTFQDLKDLPRLHKFEKANTNIYGVEGDFAFVVQRDILEKVQAFPVCRLTTTVEEPVLKNLLAAMERLLRHQAVWEEVEAQETLLDKMRTATKNYRATLMHYAAAHGDPDKAIILLHADVPTTEDDSNGRRPTDVTLVHPENALMQRVLTEV